MGHYAGALRLYVTVRYGDILQYVTFMRYAVSRWRVMPVCYGALRRYVTVRYGALLWCVAMCYVDVLQHYVMTVDNNHCYQGLQNLPYYF